MSTKRPLAKALHTVTVVARVAAALAPTVSPGMARIYESRAEQLTRAALDVLGYPEVNMLDAKEAALYHACVAAVAKASAPLLRVA